MVIWKDTKRLFADGLEQLVVTKPFEEITVKDITSYCGASRTTFYRHFHDKYELMNWIYKSDVDEIFRQHNSLHSWRNWILNILLFVQKKSTFFKSICEYRGQNSFDEFLINYSITYIVDLIKQEQCMDKLPEDVMFALRQYCAGSCYMVFRWIRHGYIELPEELTRMLMDNMPDVLRKYI